MNDIDPIGWRWTDAIERVAEILDGGGLIGYPTESSYAIGADPLNARGVDAVFALKQRSRDKPLPLVLGCLAQLAALGGEPDSPYLKKLAALWPAPLTVVVPISRPLPATCGRGEVAIRVPAHERLRDLLLRLDRPMTSTSANLSGDEAVSDPKDVRRMLEGRNRLLIEEGRLSGGDPSTIVRLVDEELTVLRVGAFPLDRLDEAFDGPVFSAEAAEISADDSRQTR